MRAADAAKFQPLFQEPSLLLSLHSMLPARIAIFASGNGSNADEIMKFFHNHPTIRVAMLLSNDPNALALKRAANWGVPTHTFTRSDFQQSDSLLNWLNDAGVTHLVLAGFLWLIPHKLLKSYPRRIINIHPALLPKYGGRGMFGMNVHRAVKLSGDKETGMTIHLVNENYDEGQVLFQAVCPVASDDTPEQIAAKVNQLEYSHYARVIERWIQDS